jgi:hypothetical protein
MEPLIPKIHPLTRPVEPEDPLELVATPVQGDPDFMLQCLVEEFAWMGWGADELMALFRSPEYPVLNQLLQHYGEGKIRERVEGLLGRSGALRFRAVVDDEPEPDEDEPPALIQLSVARITRDHV